MWPHDLLAAIPAGIAVREFANEFRPSNGFSYLRRKSRESSPRHVQFASTAHCVVLEYLRATPSLARQCAKSHLKAWIHQPRSSLPPFYTTFTGYHLRGSTFSSTPMTATGGSASRLYVPRRSAKPVPECLAFVPARLSLASSEFTLQTLPRHGERRFYLQRRRLLRSRPVFAAGQVSAGKWASKPLPGCPYDFGCGTEHEPHLCGRRQITSSCNLAFHVLRFQCARRQASSRRNARRRSIAS